jgi:hypothetical protein
MKRRIAEVLGPFEIYPPMTRPPSLRVWNRKNFEEKWWKFVTARRNKPLSFVLAPRQSSTFGESIWP